MLYLLAFGRFSSRRRWFVALPMAWAVYLAAGLGLHASGLAAQPLVGLAVLPALFLAATRVLPHPMSASASARLPPQELFARMAAAVVLVLLLTTAADTLGPTFAGVFAGAPVAATVIPCFTLALAGYDAVLRVLRGFLAGQMGFVVFFAALTPCMPTLGALAWLVALAAGAAASVLGTGLVIARR
jgi:hypothetical protein